jgi:uncharacterized protein (TIGR01777 family)
MHIALTGASGFVGRTLQKHFNVVSHIHRDDSVEEIVEKLQGVEIVINLAGAPIVKRWSEAYKRVLYESRIETTKRLVEGINKSSVKQFISTSAIGIYPNGKACDESCQSYSNDFLGDLTQAWEHGAKQCNKPTAILRFGVVLDEGGGALKQMLLPFKLGLGGVIGNGKMMMSWVTLDDLVRMYAHIMTHHLEGTYNAVSPTPVTNTTFTKALGKALHRPTFFPLPTFVLSLLYGEGASVLTDSKEVYPKAIEKSGFNFNAPTIEEAFKGMLG